MTVFAHVRILALALGLTGVVPYMAAAQTGAGPYLAGRHALFNSDFDAAAQYYTEALMRDSSNPELMENAVTAQLALGRVERALPIARQMEERGLNSQMARLVVVATLINGGDFDGLLARDPATQGVSPLVDGLVQAWAHIGAGAVSEALAEFDIVADENGLGTFGRYHKALALASMGDFEGAATLFDDGPNGTLAMSRRGAFAHAEILSQLGRNTDALQMLLDAFGAGSDPAIRALRSALDAGETLPFTHVRSATDGMAEVFFSIAAILNSEQATDYALVYARIANYLRTDHIDALLLSAELLDQMEQYDLAVATYKQVPSDSPDHHAAEQGRAEALRRSGKPDAAIEVLEQLALDYPQLASVHSALGDLLRQEMDFQAAVSAYDTAISRTPEDARGLWFLHYARAISYERQDLWTDAETDFRRALELNPDQPQVLNYLGYSLVEKQIKLDEALGMIERAVAARPDSGYIVDSLGWVLYRLGRYGEAVGHMERAVELMPVDPVVNDHLGDVYWAVGRYREAEFQWKRALSFIDPDETDGEADPDRIRRKLDVGLDTVLAEEGAPPLAFANDDG